MGRGRLGVLLAATLLLGCEHSLPPSGVSDRWIGPWQAGTPARLTAFGANAIGLSADGLHVLFTTRDDRPITGPSGERTPHDTNDVCLGLLPATGGSGTRMVCDRRPGQQDSANAVVAAAVAAGGRLLQVISVGPIDTFTPVREHLELYLGNTVDKGIRRFQMTLYHDANGQLTMPPGTLNWLTDLTWIGSATFAALGHFTPPALHGPALNYLGIVIGQIGPDSATTTLLTDHPRPLQIAAGPGGTLLLVYGSGEIVAITSTGQPRWSTRIPIAPGARLLGVGCQASGCVAATTEASPGLIRRWRFSRDGGEATQGPDTQAPGPVGRLFISAADGALIFAVGSQLYRAD
ncbi:MAG TPA: hypothetical protein VFN22_01225 [Gemmatimonadales bacterium]|nr:hypothetical protein [Gemmatimonadales bacterium]